MWKCGRCGHTVSVSFVEALVDSIEEELDLIANVGDFDKYLEVRKQQPPPPPFFDQSKQVCFLTNTQSKRVSFAYDGLSGLTVPLSLCCPGSNSQGEVEGPGRALCQVKKALQGLRP